MCPGHEPEYLVYVIEHQHPGLQQWFFWSDVAVDWVSDLERASRYDTHTAAESVAVACRYRDGVDAQVIDTHSVI